MEINPFDKLRIGAERIRSINPEIFKAYDIRGIYPQELDEEIAYKVGRALVVFFRKKKLNLVVGSDNRLSSPSLKKNLVKGILDQGGNVIDVGLSTTPMLYFAVARYRFDGGVEVTSSHNPARYNGFKIVGAGAVPVSGKTGIKKIQGLVTVSKFRDGKRGKIVKKNILADYLKFNLKLLKAKKIKRLKAVIDSGNAVPGILVGPLKKRMPLKIIPLFEKLDGSFPNHTPDPLKKENLKALQKKVLKEKADLGLAFDGDGDRIIFVDQKGNIIGGDLILALMAKQILKEKPGQKILYDIRSGNIVPETIKSSGGISVVERIGHAFIRERMRKEKIIFGGELSGHYYFKDHFYSESPLVIFFGILETISREEKPFSRIMAPFKKYFNSGEINFRTENKKELLKKLERKFKDGKVSKLDGLRVDFKDWWFLVRPSNTEPLIRLVIEAKNKKLLKQKTHFFSHILHG